MSAVINLVARDGDTVVVRITFLEDSGAGLASVSASDHTGTVLLEETSLSPECPPSYSVTIAELSAEQFPIYADSASCGLPDAVERTSFGPETVYMPLPAVPAEDPCSPHFGTAVMESEETVRIRALIGSHVDNANGIADEIAALCEELASLEEARDDALRRQTAYTAAAAVTLVTGLALVFLLPSFLKWIGLVVLAVAAGLLVAAAVYRQQAERLGREIDALRASIEEAQQRYRDAVAAATQVNCGPVAGLAIAAPDCG